MRYFLIAIVVIISFSCGTIETKKDSDKEIEKKQKVDVEKKKIRKIEIRKPIYITPKRLTDDSLMGESRKDMKEILKMANTYFDSNRFEEAEKLYKHVLDNYLKTLDSKSSDLQFCYYNIGLIAIKNKDWSGAEKMFLQAYQNLQRKSDKLDAFLLLLESLRKGEKWKRIEESVDEVLSSNPFKLSFTEENEREITLRKAEATIMLGNLEEGLKIVKYKIYQIKKGKQKSDLFYVPEYAMAQYILGKSYSYKFNSIKLEESIESLTEKCSLILEAQQHYINAIKIGIMYWTNASAFEIAKLYTDLYSEMGLRPIPEGLNEEEREIYTCELWKKISGLLRKARKTLKKSMHVAKDLNINNEYTEKSFKMLMEIDNIYNRKEKYCENPLSNVKDKSGENNNYPPKE